MPSQRSYKRKQAYIVQDDLQAYLMPEANVQTRTATALQEFAAQAECWNNGATGDGHPDDDSWLEGWKASRKEMQTTNFSTEPCYSMVVHVGEVHFTQDRKAV